LKKTVLLVILDKYADWEAAFVSTGIRYITKEEYSIKTVSLTKDCIHSLGGFTVIPDCDINSVPADYNGVILIGGLSWRIKEARAVGDFVEDALKAGKIVGGICDAATFLGAIGVLNNVKHTVNDLNDLKMYAKDTYTGEKNFVAQQAVRDHNIITANGTAFLEFAREVMIALNVCSEDKIDEWYNFYKLGYYGVSS